MILNTIFEEEEDSFSKSYIEYLEEITVGINKKYLLESLYYFLEGKGEGKRKNKKKMIVNEKIFELTKIILKEIQETNTLNILMFLLKEKIWKHKFLEWIIAEESIEDMDTLISLNEILKNSDIFTKKEKISNIKKNKEKISRIVKNHSKTGNEIISIYQEMIDTIDNKLFLEKYELYFKGDKNIVGILLNFRKIVIEEPYFFNENTLLNNFQREDLNKDLYLLYSSSYEQKMRWENYLKLKTLLLNMSAYIRIINTIFEKEVYYSNNDELFLKEMIKDQARIKMNGYNIQNFESHIIATNIIKYLDGERCYIYGLIPIIEAMILKSRGINIKDGFNKHPEEVYIDTKYNIKNIFFKNNKFLEQGFSLNIRHDFMHGKIKDLELQELYGMYIFCFLIDLFIIKE